MNEQQMRSIGAAKKEVVISRLDEFGRAFVLQCVAVWCSMLHYVAVCCVLQCGAVWCSVL